MKISAFLLTLLMLLSPAWGEVVERVAGTIGGQVYTLLDLEEAAAEFGLRLEEGQNPLEKDLKKVAFYRRVWERVVERELLDREAKRLGLEPKEEEVQKVLEDLKKKYGLGDEELSLELRRQGFDPRTYPRYLKTQLEKARIIDLIIRPKVSPSEGDLQAYYEAHKENYAVPSEVRLSQIFISSADKTEREAREKLERVLEELERGTPFEEVAKAYSEDPSAPEGGDLGYVEMSALDPAIREEIEGMQIGEVSPVVRSSKGFHILLFTDKKGGQPLPFEAVRERVMEDYFREEIEKEYRRWLEERKVKYGVKELL